MFNSTIEKLKAFKRGYSVNRKHKMIGWFFVIPGALLIFSFYFYPIIRAFLLSMQGGVGNNLRFAGAANYQRLFADTLFKKSLFNVFVYLILQVPIMLTLALILAGILNDKTLKFRSFFRTAIFVPCATSLVSYAIIFRSMFALDGFVNTVLMNLNLMAEPINWLGGPWTARLLIVIGLTWRWTGYNMIFYLAGLQNIDPAIYEAAKIDGASAFDRLTKITIPMLKPIILLTTIMSTNGTLQIFDETKNLTNGGPANSTLSVSQYIYRLSFEYVPRFGYAAAVAFVVFIIVAILSFFQMKVGDER
ncbi:lactose/L-arabinose transport system permease protein [Halanaerobium saccharolyticum]|uniref:Lactose/L-arabinose transport system permease protein n=1 Tax=Halanaerobium saccharolyticum TaxID=43595 RepID=A0A4R7Z8C2_9FIRM|nr:sugar ABC transporter permease [Halanaerobium saccharolyticum]RAK07862.1 lactose/L-arabinose transport system permease protein [Halanaerobium saccharolyticum]TDW04476.1 lactose/L-arabinose transport system permease protein [Halanaerobium saccharolyticum]TDX59812.1 lactose/L-arabinose transport system permease protein [Halanaerobium saccharolyticum]